MITLDIYISENCWSCEESLRIAEDVGRLFPELKINLLNLRHADAPEEVFAVPTYVLNGKVTFLGNPTREQLVEKISAEKSAVQPSAAIA